MTGQSSSTGGEEIAVISCLLCNGANQAEFVAEINIHFRGLEKIDEPGVLLLRKLLVCLDCGFTRFRIPKADLEPLVKGSTSGVSASQWVRSASTTRVNPVKGQNL